MLQHVQLHFLQEVEDLVNWGQTDPESLRY